MSSSGFRSPSLARKESASPSIVRKESSSPQAPPEAAPPEEVTAPAVEEPSTFVIPSLREVLLVDSQHFARFLEFSKQSMCSEALLFWKV